MANLGDRLAKITTEGFAMIDKPYVRPKKVPQIYYYKGSHVVPEAEAAKKYGGYVIIDYGQPKQVPNDDYKKSYVSRVGPEDMNIRNHDAAKIYDGDVIIDYGQPKQVPNWNLYQEQGVGLLPQVPPPNCSYYYKANHVEQKL